ncbi:hypothetical protein G3578_10590 [Brevibacillus sp. SYP-B805]|uniref:hypothetical protein n=1 Tax=Brevibacillus sp. SYP-B805 TaxID=1578199 RepID=UPI0013EBA4DA|nr:hypothetical protein [Brevibacillus sp. SYP-B805]NGQ95601.1 hypothetical protein [Brevibacillus sp. SYP-B805]
MILNNLASVVIHLVIGIITFILSRELHAGAWPAMTLLFAINLFLYLMAGGRLIQMHQSAHHFRSVMGVSVIGLLLWGSAMMKVGGDAGLAWGKFFFYNAALLPMLDMAGSSPNTLAAHVAVGVMTLLPTLFFWLGLELKRRATTGRAFLFSVILVVLFLALCFILTKFVMYHFAHRHVWGYSPLDFFINHQGNRVEMQ